MSQHYFETTYNGQPITIQMGYDRPIQYYFMVIEITGGEDDESLIYSNLDQSNPHPQTLAPYIQKLEEMGVTVPEEMLAEIAEDGANNVGNKEVFHSLVDGQHIRKEH